MHKELDGSYCVLGMCDGSGMRRAFCQTLITTDYTACSANGFMAILNKHKITD